MGRHPALGGGPPSLGEGGRPIVGHGSWLGGFREGMLITGGWSSSGKLVEAYNPHTKKICKLTNLTYTVYGHTLCGGLLCGGHLASSLSSSCLKFGPSGFVKTTVSLREKRIHHLCWNVPEGVLLLGGTESPSTTELVLRDGSASISEFELTHPTR